MRQCGGGLDEHEIIHACVHALEERAEKQDTFWSPPTVDDMLIKPLQGRIHPALRPGGTRTGDRRVQGKATVSKLAR